MSVNVPPAERLAARNAKRTWVLRGIVAVLFVAATVIGVIGIGWANRDDAQAAALAAAPACAPGTAPTGDCAGWEQETVQGVQSSKGGTDIQLSVGGQTPRFSNNTWPAHLTVGASVSVLVWRDQAQAVRNSTGDVVYSNLSPRLKRYIDITVAVSPFGFVAIMYVALLGFSPLYARRPRLRLVLAVISGSVGAGIIVGGATVGGEDSVGTGVAAGVIALASAAVVGTAIAMLGRRRRRAQRMA